MDVKDAVATPSEHRASLWVVPIATAILGAMAGSFGTNAATREDPTETVFLPLDKQNVRHLLAGWSTPEKLPGGESFCWCAATTCTVSLSSRTPADRWIAFEAAPFTYPGSPQQTVEIRLNASPLGKLTFQGQVLRIRAPASAWRSGKNVLQFDFAYAEAPKDHSATNGDSRRLSASFRWISMVGS